MRLRAFFAAALIAFAVDASAQTQPGNIPAWNLMGNPTASAARQKNGTINAFLDGAYGCTSGQFLQRGASVWACQTAGAFAGFANPTASVGLAAVNGSASTAMRSDGAPALDVTIAPIWSGQHTWTVARSIASATGATWDDVLVSAATTTITGNTGSPITSFFKVRIQQPTITDSSAVTITDAATLNVTGPPNASGSVTITNPWSIRVGTGNVSFPGTGNLLGTITSGVWNGTPPPLANGGTNANLTASNGGIVYSDATKLQILAGTVTASQCLLSGSNAAPTWGSCSGAAAVSSVANSDSTLTISPTTGSVIASLNLGHANTWTAIQTHNNSTIKLLGSSTGATIFTSANAGASNFTLTFPAITSTLSTTIASGAKALATSAIASGACSSAQTDTATGALTTDAIAATFNADPTGVTGYAPSTSGMLTILPYPTADTVNFKVCNNTGSSITPGAITLNWRVVR